MDAEEEVSDFPFEEEEEEDVSHSSHSSVPPFHETAGTTDEEKAPSYGSARTVSEFEEQPEAGLGSPGEEDTGSPREGDEGSPEEGDEGSPEEGDVGSPEEGDEGSPEEGDEGSPEEGDEGSPGEGDEGSSGEEETLEPGGMDMGGMEDQEEMKNDQVEVKPQKPQEAPPPENPPDINQPITPRKSADVELEERVGSVGVRGDEQSLVVTVVLSCELARLLDDDFYYDYNAVVSRPVVSNVEKDERERVAEWLGKAAREHEAEVLEEEWEGDEGPSEQGVGEEEEEEEMEAMEEEEMKEIKEIEKEEKGSEMAAAESQKEQELEEEEDKLPINLLEFYHSFGYDCATRVNLFVLDDKIVTFVAGNLVVLLNVESKKQTYLRSTGGTGIGCMAVHPSRKYFAVGESGNWPDINILEYPSLKLYRILRKNALKGYADMDFSPSGNLLATISTAPDNLLTIWNWRSEIIVLCCKAFSQDIYTVKFSTELPGQLITSGLGHIRLKQYLLSLSKSSFFYHVMDVSKFWKMARTFTGLKLKGDLGKFGKFEISDIQSFVEMPDGRTLSTSEAGNILMWEGGLCVAEFKRFGGRPCHIGPTQEIRNLDGELITIGLDGYIRSWELDKFEGVEIENDHMVVEMELGHEMNVGATAKPRHLVKSSEDIGSLDTSYWFMQDAYGGIWKLDLFISTNTIEPIRLTNYHSGCILACDSSPCNNLVATTGLDGSVRVYDHVTRVQLCWKRFGSPGKTLKWFPTEIDSVGSVFMVGFADGVVRTLRVLRDPDNHKLFTLTLIKVMKPHSGEVTCMGLDDELRYLATTGGDGSVFFFDVQAGFEPLGFVTCSLPITYIDWSPLRLGTSRKLLVFTSQGEALQIEAPRSEDIDNELSYELKDTHVKVFKYLSIKSRLLHEIELTKKALIEEEENKYKRKREPEEISETKSQTTDASEGEEEEEEEVVKEEEWSPELPAQPSPILVGFYGRDYDTFWISMGEYDSGYFYECKFSDYEYSMSEIGSVVATEPLRAVKIPACEDNAISCLSFCLMPHYLLAGMQSGSLHLYKMSEFIDETIAQEEEKIKEVEQKEQEQEKEQELEQEQEEEEESYPLDSLRFDKYWACGFHDTQFSDVTDLSMSHDGKFLFSTGLDGNFFVYKITLDNQKLWSVSKMRRTNLNSLLTEQDMEEVILDITDQKSYTLEDMKHKKREDEIRELAEIEKNRVRERIEALRDRYIQVNIKNISMPYSFRLFRKEFTMDVEMERERRETLEERLELLDRETAWEMEKCRITLDKVERRYTQPIECRRICVRRIGVDHAVYTYRTRKPGELMKRAWSDLREITQQRKLEEEREREREKQLWLMKEQPTDLLLDINDAYTEAAGEGLDIDLEPEMSLLGNRGRTVNRAIKVINNGRKRREFRRLQWARLQARALPDDYEDALELMAIEKARRTVGDLPLKCSLGDSVPEHMRATSLKTLLNITQLTKSVIQFRRDFNQEVLDLRDRKIALRSELSQLASKLEDIQHQLKYDPTDVTSVIPILHPDEQPEKAFHFTNEKLRHWNLERKNKQKQEQQEPGLPGGSGLQTKHQHLLFIGDYEDKIGYKSTLAVSGHADYHHRGGLRDETLKLNERLKRISKEKETRFKYEEAELVDRINHMIGIFDAQVLHLKDRKFRLDLQIRFADLRFGILMKEFLLLKDFELVEDSYVSKVELKHQERDVHVHKMDETTSVVEVSTHRIEELMKTLVVLEGECVTYLESDKKWKDYLLKVYRKKVKRKKRKTGEGEGDDERDEDAESESESESSSDESEDDDDDDDDDDGDDNDDEIEKEEYDLDVCPLECDQNKYDHVCELREARLDVVDEINELKLLKETCTKELEAMNKKLKIIDVGVEAAEKELNDFQVKKQGVLNNIDTTIVVRLHQFRCLEEGLVPPDFYHRSLMIDDNALTGLRVRIKELEHEFAREKQSVRDCRKRKTDLQISMRKTEAYAADQAEICRVMMVKKFGKVVDLVKVETCGAFPLLEQMKDQQLRLLLKLEAEDEKMKEEVEREDESYLEELADSTDLLREVTNLNTKSAAYGEQLNLQARTVGYEFTGEDMSEAINHERMIVIVEKQRQKIIQLKKLYKQLAHKSLICSNQINVNLPPITDKK